MSIRAFKVILFDGTVKFAYAKGGDEWSLKNIAVIALAQDIKADVAQLKKANPLKRIPINLFPLHSIEHDKDGHPIRCIALSCSEQNSFWKSYISDS